MLTSPKRRLICLTAFAVAADLALPTLARAQSRPYCRFSIDDGWSDTRVEFITRRANESDSSGVPQVVDRIKQALTIEASFDIYIAEQEDNASALVANGRKVLVVDVGFLERLNQMAGTEWAAIQVIAHEVGHHIAGFSADSHSNELNADYWSGQSLQRLGSDRVAATRSILSAGTDRDTRSHPNKHRRAATIARGWDDAARGVIDYNFCLGCR